MKAVRKIIENAPERISIEVPQELRNQTLEVIILTAEERPNPNEEPKKAATGNYDFSDFIGTAKWEGDAVAEQRKLRNEWD